jgi:hypothetical protein
MQYKIFIDECQNYHTYVFVCFSILSRHLQFLHCNSRISQNNARELFSMTL